MIACEKWDRDLDIYIVASVGEYHVSFKIYEASETSYVGDDTVFPSFPRSGCVSSSDYVDKIAEAQVWAHGDVKWDGCSNWHIDDMDNCMLHGCSRADLLDIGRRLASCWDWASELLPSWDVAEIDM